MTLFKKYDLSHVVNLNSVLSTEMLESIDLWNNILSGNAEWNYQPDSKPCGIVPCTIGELAKPVAEEVDVSAPENEELDKIMKRVNEQSHELVQNLVALGGSVVRPIFSNGKVQFEIIRLGNYIPTGYDLDNTLTGCVIAKKIKDNDKDYLLVERHNFANKTHETTLEFYLIKNKDNLVRVSLDSCPKTEGLTENYKWENVEKPFIVEIRNRMPNIVDGSQVPCALWQGTENLIQNADEQYGRILWEQEGGELKVFADTDLFKKRQDGSGKLVDTPLPPKLNKLIVKLNGNGVDAEKITTVAPTLRTDSQVSAFNEILRRCELAWNIGKGTLSDLQTTLQTATQYTGGKKTLYSMVDSIESELEEKYQHLAYIFATMLNYYQIAKFNDVLEISYNDSARKDPEKMRQIAQTELGLGIISVPEYRMQFFGEDKETAEQNSPVQTMTNSIGGLEL